MYDLYVIMDTGIGLWHVNSYPLTKEPWQLLENL